MINVIKETLKGVLETKLTHAWVLTVSRDTGFIEHDVYLSEKDILSLYNQLQTRDGYYKVPKSNMISNGHTTMFYAKQQLQDTAHFMSDLFEGGE